MPAGTPVVFIADGSLDAHAREGTTVNLHLRDALTLDGIVVAPAGTRARLIVGGHTDNAGVRTPSITIDRVTIHAGLLPVRSLTPIVAPVAAGEAIDAATEAEIGRDGDRITIRIPFPFPLSADRPAAYYTPTPARTAPPHPLSPGRARPLPTASPSPAATTPTGVPVPAASPTKAP